MTFKQITLLVLFIISAAYSRAQQKAMTIPEARSKGLMKVYDSLYKSALHTDTTKAVFKTEEAQEKMQKSYEKMVRDLGDFLRQNNFQTAKPLRCFQRIYFNADGTIDHYLFDFKGKPGDLPTPEEQKTFEKLLDQFAGYYRLEVNAPVRFAQCSPVSFNW